MSRLSLRTRLLLIGGVLLTVGLVTSNAVAVGFLSRHLVDRVDQQLRMMGALFSRLTPAQAAGSPGGGLPAAATGVLDMISDVYVAYLAPDGRPLAVARTPASGADPDLPRLDAAAVAARAQRPFTVGSDPGTGSWRVVAEPRLSGLGSGAEPVGGSVVVAAALTEVDSTIDQMWRVCLLAAATVLAALAVAGWFAVRAGLCPLGRIEQTAAAIAGGNLTHRVPDLAPARTEVGRLSAALNGMLAQIEAAFSARADSEARMRRFLGDVSHELRTPLFSIKGFAELYRMGGLPDRADVDRTMRHIERESTRLARLAEDLLLLAQLDERPDMLHRTPMDLRTLAADARRDLHALDPSRPVQLTGPGGGPPTTAPVLGDEARLRQVVTNLVGNAVTHTPPGTPVRIGVGTTGTDAVLEIADEGPGLTGDQADRVFDRFYRSDGSRSRTAGGGSGLGLAIVRSLVQAHDGRVELRTAPGQGATFRVVLPAATAAEPGRG